jgi:uncharacterized membrane protein
LTDLIREILSEAEETLVVEAISKAEKKTSGEIRIHLCAKTGHDVMKEAERQFRRLGMDRTELRNGVLIYVAIQSHRFAILGDKGINDKVPANFWESTRDAMSSAFREQKFADGLIAGITEAGEQLKAHFPIQEDDQNELSNEISY